LVAVFWSHSEDPVLGEWILKGIAFVVLGLLNLLGWKRAGEWLDKMVGEVDKEEKPVV
jgi:hypothetical protein